LRQGLLRHAQGYVPVQCRFCSMVAPRHRLEMRGNSSCTSHVTRHTSHVTRHTSHVTHYTSHVTRLTSHVTRHTSHVTRHTSVILTARSLGQTGPSLHFLHTAFLLAFDIFQNATCCHAVARCFFQRLQRSAAAAGTALLPLFFFPAAHSSSSFFAARVSIFWFYEV
jgi:hypothetical protein